MSIDSQSVEVERIRHKVSRWQLEQPDFEHRLRRAVRFWCHPALSHSGLDDRDFAQRLMRNPDLRPLCYLLCEQAFADVHNNESMFDRYINSAGRWENRLCYRYLHKLTHSTPSLWRVIDVESGSCITVTPHDGGGMRRVQHRTYDNELRSGDLLLTRLIDLPAGPMFSKAVISFSNADEDTVPDSLTGVRYLLSITAIQLLETTAISPNDGEEALERDIGNSALSLAGQLPMRKRISS